MLIRNTCLSTSAHREYTFDDFTNYSRGSQAHSSKLFLNFWKFKNFSVSVQVSTTLSLNIEKKFDADILPNGMEYNGKITIDTVYSKMLLKIH